MNAASPTIESDSGTFEDLLTRHRADLRSRVDSLRCSVKRFDEKCRIHFGSGRRGLPRRRSDGDLALCGHLSSTVVALAEGGAADWTTSGSDTDESVIEVCPVSQKLRQSRTTQTSTPAFTCNDSRGTHNFADGSMQVRDASTQTTDSIGLLEISNSDFLPTLKDQVISDQLLEVFVTLASQRSRNGLHRSHAKNHSFNSPLDKRYQCEESRISEIISKLTTLRSISDSLRSSSHEPKRRHLFKKKSKTKAQASAVLTNIGQNSPEIKYTDGFETTCNWYDYLDCSSDVILTSRYDCHAEDDLWRLAEEGRLPWKCDLIQTRSSRVPPGKTLDTDSPIKLFYCNEVVSLFGPVRLFKRHRRQRIYPPVWGLVSIPPMLGVIPEH